MSRFVIHQHKATHMHWDFRLDMDGVLKSWAIPKEPSMKEGEKHLAIQVEDHPRSYIGFEGEIPEGEYGAGTVRIWDKGTYTLLNKKPEKLIFELNGRKLRGKFVLLQTRFATDKRKQKTWLFFKMQKNY